ncbi:hypothetical protein CEQ90_11830 [Lewinellaceae bacterium SD302]|nr:hypothetical protein CEQ90_11830 [Lewinellaceae bacterium SD302]
MQILSVVFGIIFVLLLLSLLATTLMELIASFFSLRGRNLTKALRNMLSSSDENEILLQDFKANSLYRHLTEQYGRRSRADAPSYMSAETFQSILFDIILKGEPIEKLKERIDALPDQDLRNVLNQLLRESGGQLDLFRHEVQNWYSNVMDRAGGWYKRYTQKILVFLGLGIAIVFNADTVGIYERLSSNPEQLEQIVALADNYVAAREGIPTEEVFKSGRNLPAPSPANTTPAQPSPGYTGPAVVFDSLGNPVPGPIAEDPTIVPELNQNIDEMDSAEYARFQSKLDEFRDILNYEFESVRSPLGLGWEGVSVTELGFYDLITKLLGFILTALAISMGAPFWFDLLRKVANIRSAGSRPS